MTETRFIANTNKVANQPTVVGKALAKNMPLTDGGPNLDARKETTDGLKMFDEKKKAARKILDEQKKAAALRDIAEEEAEAGLPLDKIRATFEEAKNAARKIAKWKFGDGEEDVRAEALGNIAVEEAKAGLWEEANETAGEIGWEDVKARVLANIAVVKAEALGNIAVEEAKAGLPLDKVRATFKKAKKAAWKTAWQHDYALRNIAEKEAKAGLWKEANETAGEIGWEDVKAGVLGNIAKEEVKAGLPLDKIRATFKEAKKAIREHGNTWGCETDLCKVEVLVGNDLERVEPPHWLHREFFVKIAVEEAGAGLLEEAKKTVKEIGWIHVKEKALWEIWIREF